MTNSISTAVVEDTKNIHDTVIKPHDSQCQSCLNFMSSCHDKDTDRLWCFGLCLGVITKTSQTMSYLLSKCHYRAKVT